MLGTARKLFSLLSRREQIQLGLLFIAVLVMAFIEMVSIAAVLPFLSVAADPAQVHSNAWLNWAYEASGLTSTTMFLVALGGAALLALVVSNAWMAATLWAQYRFAHGRTHTVGMRLMKHYLAQPYVFYLHRNSADLGKNILTEVEQVTERALVPGLKAIAKIFVCLAIVSFLIIFDPLLALIVIAILGGAYSGIYLAVRQRLTRIGRERVVQNTARYKVANEAFGAIKDIKLLGREDAFLREFARPSRRYARYRATAKIVSEIPRYALEAIAFGGVLIIAVYLILVRDNLAQVIPVLGLYAFAGFRLMPTLQQIFHGLTQVRFSAPAVDNLYRELRQATPPKGSLSVERTIPKDGESQPHALPLSQGIALENVTIAYPGGTGPVLRDVSIQIEARTIVGIIGPTGSGKTTLVDVILGLLRPQSGEIRIDNTLLTESNLRAWQNAIGYVPQQITLSDESIARNIAFGIPPDHIDAAAVERAARAANIHRFVVSELPDGYGTVVGERGVRLSGGQRQRIGIARALYHDPALLVLDEATNALDPATEAEVLEAIRSLAASKTVLIIAHRPSTVRMCDCLYMIRRNQVIQTTSFEAVAATRGMEEAL